MELYKEDIVIVSILPKGTVMFKEINELTTSVPEFEPRTWI